MKPHARYQVFTEALFFSLNACEPPYTVEPHDKDLGTMNIILYQG